MRNPKITHKKGKDGGRLVYVDGKLFVDRDADLDDNTLTAGPLHPFFYPANTYVQYLLKDSDKMEEFIDILKGKHPNKKLRMPVFQSRDKLGGIGTIPRFWKEQTAKKFLVGAVQYWIPKDVDEYGDIIVVTHMAVSWQYRRNKVNAYMFDYLSEKYPGKEIYFHDLTEAGRAFMDSYGGYEYGG